MATTRDYATTKDGVKLLSGALPREPGEIERAIGR